MLIGLKLDVGFADNEEYRRLYGQREILPFLRELGVEAVETAVGPETETDALMKHIARCIGAGLKMSLHPYSEGTIFNPTHFSHDENNACRGLHQHFLAVAAEAARQQESAMIVNIHSAAGTASQARDFLMDQSISFFSWAGDWCRHNAPEVAVAAELQISPNPDEPRQRIGDTYEELLEVALRSGVSACWDFGHAYWNTYRYGWPLYPPEALLPRIGHVHCHDVRNSDHQPLLYDAVPWRDFLRLLIDSRYDGRIILEVPPSEFLDAGGIQTLTDSLQLLRAWVQQCRSDAQVP